MKKVNNLEELKDELLVNETALVKFGATWCNPCKQQHNILESVDSNPDYSGIVEILEIDIDEISNDALNAYGIRSVPTMILFQDGKEKSRLNGLQQANKLTEFLDKFC